LDAAKLQWHFDCREARYEIAHVATRDVHLRKPLRVASVTRDARVDGTERAQLEGSRIASDEATSR